MTGKRFKGDQGEVKKIPKRGKEKYQQVDTN